MNFQNITEVLSKPFPHIVIDNFLDESQYKEILNEILEVDKKKSVNKVMGGRYQYSVDLFDNECSTKKLFDFFNSSETYQKIQNLFINISETSEYSLDKKNFTHFLKKRNIFQNYLKRIFPQILKKTSFYIWIFLLLKIIILENHIMIKIHELLVFFFI